MSSSGLQNPTGYDGTGTIILNVDDDEAGRYAVTRILRMAGFEVHETGDGASTYRIIETIPPDLILLDVNLPDTTGYEICQRLKNDPATRAIPILLMSASFIKSQDQIRGLDEGADGYLTEPLEPGVLIATIRALLRIRNAEREVEMARRTAEMANHAKDQFIAALSHELRTPLTPIIAAIDALSTMDLPEIATLLIDIIRRNAELETRLIDDLLDLTRIVRGKLQLNLEKFEVHALLTDVLEICRSDLSEKQILVTLALHAEESWVSADRARMHQVFWNLLKNAVKFTPPCGRITIGSSNVDSETIRITVADTGIGMEKEVLARIFDAFEQGTESITQRFGGLGLGLAITKNIVTMHGGSLTAASEGIGHGATFCVDLAVIPSEQSLPAPNANTIRILLVDDHHDTSSIIKLVLERQGYRVQTASSVKGALDMAGREEFDLLISDIGLPDGTGFDLISELRKRSGIKGIAMSGYGMEEDRERSRQSGFQEHLTKPVAIPRLHEAIRDVLAQD